MAAWKQLEENGIRVLALRDNPRFSFDVPSCLGAYGADGAECGKARAETYAASLPTADPAVGNVTYADIADMFCDSDWCPATRDGILLYRDKHHLTRTFVLTQTGRIGRAVEAALAEADMAS